MNEAAKADRILVLSEGSLLLDGTPREVFSNVMTMKNAGLSVPETIELLFELYRRGYPVDLTALSIPECTDELLHFLEA